MARAIVILLVLGGIAAAYVLFTGALDDFGKEPVKIQDRPATGDETTGAELGGRPAEAPGPKQTVPAMLAIAPPAKVLFLASSPHTFNALVLMSLDATKGVSYATWYTDRLDAERAGPAAGPARGMSALEAAPTAAWLEQEEIRAVLADGLDPHALPTEFWTGVEDRVRRGVMGLSFHAFFPVGANNEWVTVHPALTHPIVSKLLPVERAAELRADPIPGLYPEGRPLLLTGEGRRHAASRILPDPDESASFWRLAAEGAHGWRTAFVYPVEKSKEGSRVLLEVSSVGAEAWPALIAGKDDRVLWVGLEDFGRQAYYNSDSHARMVIVINHWIAWLVGP
jgi:hypothetical protein